MHFNMSEESSKRVLSGVKQLTDAGQNYFTSLSGNSTNPTSSGKKIINTILLVPIIVPTVITALSFGFTWLFLNAVNPQKNDSTLSKIAKSVAKILIGVIAAAVLIPCIILNLVISSLPSLIFLAINKSILSALFTNQTSVNTESSPNQIVDEIVSEMDKAKKVGINNEDYDRRIGKEMDNFTTDPEESSEEQHNSIYNHELVSNSQLHNQPDVEIISRNLEGEQAGDQTVVLKRINGFGVHDGKAMMRKVQDENGITVKGVFTGNTSNQQTGLAGSVNVGCRIVPGGMDFNFSMSTRNGDNQQAALQTLLESEEARTMISGNRGLLSIEQHSGRQNDGVN